MGIHVEGVTKRFGSFTALHDVSLDVPQGSLTALLGPSGSGKSTLLRVIAGLERPDAGTVTISGEDATTLAPRKRGVGFVFQHYAAFKHMTVRGNIAFGLKIRKRPRAEVRARVDELLALVQLQPFADRYPSQLSGEVARGSGWHSHGRSPSSRMSFFSMNPSARSTRVSVASSENGYTASTKRFA